MYSVVLTTLMGLGTTSVDCCWARNGRSSYSGNYAVVTEMPMSYGYSPGPSCGCGAPMVPPPAPMGDMGMTLPPPVAGNILPPAPYGEGAPTPLPPALNETRTAESQAQFVVRLPENAKLVVEDREIPGTGKVRVFVSPPLEPGKDYLYDLVIEMNLNGKVVRDQQTIKFQAGKTANVTFPEPRPDSAAPQLAAPAKPMTTRIRVRMPDGAALYVEGRPWAGSVVQTPPLDPTRTHYYQLSVEVIRDGRRAVATREVAFRAGQELTVDFTSVRLIPANVAMNSR
jgi:uncharacterized protein (TIGR03000 family)